MSATGEVEVLYAVKAESLSYTRIYIDVMHVAVGETEWSVLQNDFTVVSYPDTVNGLAGAKSRADSLAHRGYDVRVYRA